MTFGQQLNKSANKDFFETEDQFTKLMQKLELKRMRKSISIREATKNKYMTAKYSILIIEDDKIDPKEFFNMYKHKACIFIAALPEKYLDSVVVDIEKMQDKAAQEGL